MKLLHVSDWHLGRTTYGEPRAEDHDAVLAEIISIAAEQRPDVIVHTGDLFDAVRPAYTDMARGVTVLQELGAIAPVVVLCGNHDSPALFDLLGQLVGPKSPIRFLSRARTPEAGGIVHLPAADGSEVRLAGLPFVHANRMLDGFEDATSWHGLYADRIHVVEQALARGLLEGYDASRDIAIFAAHLHVGGAALSGSERRVHVGDTYASHLEHIPAVSYAAFGHIHKPQSLPGSVLSGTYAGSPLQLDFGELGEEKRVVLVEARPGKAAPPVSIPLRGGRPLWRFDGTLDELAVRAPQAGRCLALVTIHTETTTSGLHLMVQDRLPDAVLLQVTEVPADRKLAPIAGTDAGDGPEPGIDELFRDYLTEVGTRGAAADRVMATFATLLDAVESEQLVRFPEEDSLPAPAAVSAGVAAGTVAATTSSLPPAPSSGSATSRTLTCQRCGRTFEAPVRRGRPPTRCSRCL